ncbi:MAG: aspartate/glutamate racemase family protein [Capsulimonadaceae bacterium]
MINPPIARPRLAILLHTSPVHVPVFDSLLADLAPEIDARHRVDESLLADSRTAGTVTPDIDRRIASAVTSAREEGACAVLCTCSTIAGAAEVAGLQAGVPVIRVDRPMAAAAVATGRRIMVVAALADAIAPSRALLFAEAQKADVDIDVRVVVVSGSWRLFESGDQSGYVAMIAARLQAIRNPGDVIVLAQASMAGAAGLCPNYPVPILTSPRLAIEALVREVRENCSVNNGTR